MHIDCILFDLDGTLVDTNADLTVAMNHTLKAFNAPPILPEHPEQSAASTKRTRSRVLSFQQAGGTM